ncbi:hypothetical protein [Legionella spiritensis]|nr:hypothetical protein [Legionella spiritensis]
MMKKLIYGFISALFFNQLHAQALPVFDDVIQHLSNGHEVNLVVDLNRCTIDDPNEVKIPAAKWFVKPQIVTFTDTFISIDGVKYAHGRAPLPASGLVQKGTILVNNQGNSHIVLSFFDAETNKKLMNDVNIQCSLNNGLQFFTR